MAANSSNGEGCWVLEKADHKQTDVVGDLAGLALVAVGQAAVPRADVPGAAAQQLRDPPESRLNQIADLRSARQAIAMGQHKKEPEPCAPITALNKVSIPSPQAKPGVSGG